LCLEKLDHDGVSDGYTVCCNERPVDATEAKRIDMDNELEALAIDQQVEEEEAKRELAKRELNEKLGTVRTPASDEAERVEAKRLKDWWAKGCPDETCEANCEDGCAACLDPAPVTAKPKPLVITKKRSCPGYYRVLVNGVAVDSIAKTNRGWEITGSFKPYKTLKLAYDTLVVALVKANS
jgi:hypothetical protein